MFRKYATAQVLAVAPAERLQHLAHRAVFSFVPRPGYLYVRSRSISSRCNDNFDYFGPEEIAKSYKTFVGKPVFINHNNHDHRRARGMVVDAVLHRDRNPDGSPDVWCETLMEIDAKTYPRLAKAILDGDIDRTSMGCDVDLSKCSACGNEATSPLEYCSHIPGQKGKRVYKMGANGQREGVLVYEVCSGLKYFENSLLVEPPADPTAFFVGSPVLGPGLDHLKQKAASLQAVLSERPAETMPASPRLAMPNRASPSPAVPRPLQHTATSHQSAAGDDWSVGMGEERRRRAEELGSKLWEGIHQAFDPLTSPEARISERNAKVMNDLQGLGYRPEHIKFDPDDDDHPYAQIEGNRGWYAVDHSGPHLEIKHHGTGGDSHDLIDLQHYDKESRSQYRRPGYGPHEAEQELHHWTDGDPEQTGGIAAHLEQHDPRIKRWQQRHQAAAKAQVDQQAEAEGYLHENPISANHILDRVKMAAGDQDTLHSGMRWYHDAHEIAKTMAAKHEVPLHHVAGALGVYSASTAPAPNFHMASLALHAGRGIYSSHLMEPHPTRPGKFRQVKDKHGNPVFTGDLGVGGHGGMAEGDYDYHGKPMASSADAHKVDRIFSGEHYEKVINSSKTKNYARVIENPDNDHDVVIDRHAVAAAVGHVGNSGEPYDAVHRAIENRNAKGSGATAGRIYDRIGDAYREATHRLNNAPEHADLRQHLHQSGLLGKGEQIKPHQVQALAWVVQKQISDQHARNDMTEANRNLVDVWQRHYTNRYGVSAHQPLSAKGFYGLEPHEPAAQKAASMQHEATPRHASQAPPNRALPGRAPTSRAEPRRTQHIAYGETRAPQNVDTLRDERCAICGNDVAYDGRECLVCGYLAPPKALGDPDTDKAKRLDDLKQSVDDALLDVDPSRKGADFDPGDLDAIGAEENPILCPQCGTAFDPVEDEVAEGDPCPDCGKGVLAQAEPEEGEEGELAPGEDEQDQAQDEAEQGLPGAEQAQDEDVEEDEDEDEDEEVRKRRPASRAAAAAKYQPPLKGIDMQKALAALAQLQELVEHQQHEHLKMQRRLAVKDSQIVRLTYGLQAIAQHLGPDVDTMVRSAMLHKRADEQNPAQPIPEPAPEPAVDGTVVAETPEATADVNQPGMVPGSTQDVAADVVTTAYTPGQDVGAAPLRNLVDVTRPIDGAQGPRPLSETKTNVDVRAGNPMNPQTAFPLGGDFAQAQRTGSLPQGGDLKTMASIRLARLRIATGEDADDLLLAQKIATELDLGAINTEIQTLDRVLKTSTRRQQSPQAPRGAVPRPAPGVGRTVPPLTSQAGLRSTSTAREDDADLALIFLGDQALSE